MKKLNQLFGMVILLLSLPVQAETTTTTYYHTDALGSIIAASDEEGKVIWEKTYDSHGREVLSTEDGKEFEGQAYTGKPYDEETGLVYLGQRYYDPQIKRFMGMDPVGFTASNPASFNRYTYANNNPYKFIDPDGRQAVSPLMGFQQALKNGDINSVQYNTAVRSMGESTVALTLFALTGENVYVNPFPGGDAISSVAGPFVGPIRVGGATKGLGPAGSGAASSAGQLTANACGMACGQRLLAGEGLSVFQSNLARGFYKGLTPEQLAKNLNQFSSGFRGIYAYPTSAQLRGLASNGQFIARLGGNPGHFVTVESIAGNTVRFFDPAGGVIRSQDLKEFTSTVSGLVFK